MRNTLSDLNNVLFETIERIQDDDLTDEELDREIKRSQAVADIAELVVRNGELALKTLIHLNEYGYGGDKAGKTNPALAPVPAMLEAKQ